MTNKLNNKNLLKQILVWFISFSFIMGVYGFVIKNNRPFWGSFYLISISLILVISVSKIKKSIAELDKKKLIILLTLLLTHLLTWLLVKDRPSIVGEIGKKNTFSNVQNTFLILKPFEVLVQQLLLLWLVKILSGQKISRKRIVVYFFTLFGLSHFWLFLNFHWFMTTYLIIAAISASILFPILLLKKDGLIYSYTAHLLFYILSAIIFHL